ncbi:MAG: hypothetical protein Q7R57_07105 [Dehalococcoidales bacterium]|nr:hypothetical protein [Dehalococcoidales bacterium]
MKPDVKDIAFEPDEPEEITEAQPDLPPEFCHYRDEGCEMADSCLSCPFPQCVYEQPRGRQHWMKRLRAREMARLFTTGSKGLEELAEMFGISRRTVQRALKVAMNETRRGDKQDESRV